MRLIDGARHLTTVITWKPVAATAAATTAWIGVAARPSGLLLSASAAAVAAATAYALDDPAAATLQSSPTTLLRRRAHRITLTLPLLVAFWTLATMIVQRSQPDVPFAAYTLQFATLVAIALAASATMMTVAGDHARGGTFGALAVIVCFGTAFLPARSLQFMPSDPARPGALRQLIVVLAIAVALLLASSTDPARRLLQVDRRRAPRADNRRADDLSSRAA